MWQYSSSCGPKRPLENAISASLRIKSKSRKQRTYTDAKDVCFVVQRNHFISSLMKISHSDSQGNESIEQHSLIVIEKFHSQNIYAGWWNSILVISFVSSRSVKENLHISIGIPNRFYSHGMFCGIWDFCS